MRTTGAAYAALLVVLVGFGLGAILFLSPGNESTQRLGLFFGLAGTAAACLVAAIRADVAATRLNGGLDERIRRAVTVASGDRRLHDSHELPGDPLARVPGDPGEAGDAGAG